MVNTHLLKAKLKEKNLVQEDVARMLNINPATFNRKINNADGNCITVKEVEMLRNILEIPQNELVRIFFAPNIA